MKAPAPNHYSWINPVGGLGDALMLSGILKLVMDREPARRFNLVRRPKYLPILAGHPAICLVGHAQPGSVLLSNDYWSREPLGAGRQRAFQILARMYGLEGGVPEELFVPGSADGASWWRGFLPWKQRNVLLAPASASPRKTMSPHKWHEVVGLLKAEGVFVAQAGTAGEVHIRNAYSLLGLTSPRELIALVRCFDAVLTCDNFAMHASHLTRTPAVVLWGPTSHEVYGYAGQCHLQAPACPAVPKCCIGPEHPELYSTWCPHGARHCMDSFESRAVARAVLSVLDASPGRRGPADRMANAQACALNRPDPPTPLKTREEADESLQTA